MNISSLHKIFLEHPNVCTDTRNITDNSIFFALKGDNFNANNFAKDALSKGCSYAVVDKKDVAINEHYILVDNVLQTLQELANYHRKYCATKIIAITGTNGKTTTKELIKKVLETTFNTIATEGNLNNHIGVPLSLLRIQKDTDFAVIEMGANHLGEIKALCNITEPDFGIITNIGTAHIEGFGSIEGIIKTKTELYQAVAQKKGTLFVNIDNPILSQKSTEFDCRLYTYGTNSSAQVIGKYIASTPFLEAIIEETSIRTNLLGNYNFENILAAYSIGKYFSIEKSKIIKAITDYTPKNNRSQLIKTEKNTIILDAYNANPTSMKAAILNFAEMDYPNKILILGDMLELGYLSKDAHLEIKEILKEKQMDSQTWLVGNNFSENKEGNFNYFKDVFGVIDYLTKNTLEGKQILIKGSRGIKLEKLIEKL